VQLSKRKKIRTVWLMQIKHLRISESNKTFNLIY
jgi:hypothetical protein